MLKFGATILPDPPCSRFVELVQLAEECGFDAAWTYDSHILWQDGAVFIPTALAATERIQLGFCVTNPGTREPTTSASYHATLNSMYPGRIVNAIGRGDSARRTIGYAPVTVGEFRRSVVLIRELMNGRPGTLNDMEITLEWAAGLPEIPIYVAGYGPMVLGIAGSEANGVIIQLADLDIIDWIMDQARAAAAEAGRDPASIGMEGRVSWGDGGIATVVDHAERWRSAGATHIAVNTMGAGLGGVDGHIRALAEAAGALGVAHAG